MGTKIQVAGSSEAGNIPVRRRNVQGRQTTQLSVTIPNELNQTINGIAVKTKKSRSLVITELIEKGLKG